MRTLVVIVLVYTGVFLAFCIAACAVYFLSPEISRSKKKAVLKVLCFSIGLPVFFWWFSFMSGYASITPGAGGLLAAFFMLVILLGVLSAGREIVNHFFSVIGSFVSRWFYKPDYTKGVTVTPGPNQKPIDQSKIPSAT